MKRINDLHLLWIPGLLALGIADMNCPRPALSSPEPQVAEEREVEPVWSGHPVQFCLLTEAPWQYVAYYNADRAMTVAARRLGDEEWNIQRLPSTLGWDSHNYVTLALDREGCLHVSGNMHGAPLVYFRSEKPHDIATLAPVHRMTGEAEQRVTYPTFLRDAEGRLCFLYRDGGSGDGRDLINAYDEKTRTWRRRVDAPLWDGLQHSMNAYHSPFVKGPDGWFHVAWMWRDTGDCQTNHDLAYARSRDLVHWESAAGQPVALPITPDHKDLTVDPVPSRQGLINMGFGVGFDTAKRAVVHYHKYDADGNSQIYLARWENGAWQIRPVSSWSHRWQFGGGGAIACAVGAEPLKVLPDAKLVLSWWNEYYGNGTWQLDPKTLTVTGKVNLPSRHPGRLRALESDTQGMEVRFAEDSGASGDPRVRYCLRWETLPVNRDQPRTGPSPAASRLKVFKLLSPE